MEESYGFLGLKSEKCSCKRHHPLHYCTVEAHFKINHIFGIFSWARDVQVMGMYVQEEWVYWKDESSMNLDSQGGLYPRVSRSKFLGHLDTKIFYCYYTPMPGGSLGVCAFLTLCLVYNQRTCYHGNIHSLSLLTMTSFYIIKKPQTILNLCEQLRGI